MTWIGGARGSGGTQLPSGTAQGSTWNVDLIERGGRMIGAEARAKGFNVMLAGGINLMRDPRNGRTFEYLGEDPLHSGLLGGAAVRGIQANRVISTLKHYAINPQETGRAFMNAVIAEDALRESDLLAFEIAIEQGDPGAIMCAYNATNGPQSCGSRFLLTDVLRDDWGFAGFVMSDWGAVDALDYALAGLDQQSGAGIDPAPFFGKPALLVLDVGVAGLWRLLERMEEIRRCRVVIAVAGMEGALFSVLAGLVRAPVIAVPTSVGYGVAEGGKAALSSALASCAPGLVTVNIDNGFGAAAAAVKMLNVGQGRHA